MDPGIIAKQENLAAKLELALMHMATGTGSLSKRLSEGYYGYLVTVEWEKDRGIIPENQLSIYSELTQYLEKGLLQDIRAEKEKWKDSSYALANIGALNVIAKWHPKKSGKVAKLLSELYSDLNSEIQFNLEFKKRG